MRFVGNKNKIYYNNTKYPFWLFSQSVNKKLIGGSVTLSNLFSPGAESILRLRPHRLQRKSTLRQRSPSFFIRNIGGRPFGQGYLPLRLNQRPISALMSSLHVPSHNESLFTFAFIGSGRSGRQMLTVPHSRRM